MEWRRGKGSGGQSRGQADQLGPAEPRRLSPRRRLRASSGRSVRVPRRSRRLALQLCQVERGQEEDEEDEDGEEGEAAEDTEDTDTGDTADAAKDSGGC
jgi:hypothetical protein